MTLALISSLPAMTVGAPVSATLASGGTPPYAFLVTTGWLPAGLTLDPVLGILFGVAGEAQAYDFTVTVTDSASASATQEYVGVVTPASATLGVLEAGEPMVPINLLGPTPPMPWFIHRPYVSTITAGMLPDGIALNSATAELSGTPSSPGNFSFTVQVNDSTGATLVNQAFTGSVVGLALFVEDGSRVLGANAYVSLAQANAILAQEIRDLTAWNALTPTQQKVQIIAATRWLDDKVVWTGDRKSDPVRPRVLQMNPPLPLQSLGWPRKGAFDRERRKVRDDVVPFQVLRATALLANYLINDNAADQDQAGIRRFRTDTFEIEYQQGWFQSPAPPWLKFVLFGLGQLGNELGLKKIVRV
jgi:hypothetical protein